MEIEVKNLNKKFDNILAVNNLNFKIKKNKTLGLLGPNGCGKTTTIGMMLGLIKPSNGQIIINNFDINKTDKNLILKYINFAYKQKDDNLSKFLDDCLNKEEIYSSLLQVIYDLLTF